MSARSRLRHAPLTELGMAKEMRRVFPRRNNFCEVNYPEILVEALHFGITTRGTLRKLLLRHRKVIAAIDRKPIDALHVRIYSEDMGHDLVRDLLRRQMWFGWEALFRLALELEFREKYVAFSEARNGGSPFAPADGPDGPPLSSNVGRQSMRSHTSLVRHHSVLCRPHQ